MLKSFFFFQIDYKLHGRDLPKKLPDFLRTPDSKRAKEEEEEEEDGAKEDAAAAEGSGKKKK